MQSYNLLKRTQTHIRFKLKMSFKIEDCVTYVAHGTCSRGRKSNVRSKTQSIFPYEPSPPLVSRLLPISFKLISSSFYILSKNIYTKLTKGLLA